MSVRLYLTQQLVFVMHNMAYILDQDSMFWIESTGPHRCSFFVDVEVT